MRLINLHEAAKPDNTTFEEIAADCIAAAKELDFNVHTLSNGTPIITNKRQGKTISILAGMHGDERSGPIFLRKLLRNMAAGRQNKPPKSVLIIPIVNDKGWNNYSRKWGQYDPNRQFKTTTQIPHIAELMDVLRDTKPYAHWDLHEHPGSRSPYIFDYSKDTTDFGDKLIEHMKARRVPWTEESFGSDTNSESFVRLLGTDRTVTTELPPVWSMDRRVKWLQKAYDFIMETKF